MKKVTPVSLQTQHTEASWTAPTFASIAIPGTVPDSGATQKHEATDLLNDLDMSCPQGPRPRSMHVMTSEDEPVLKGLMP